ncbi:MAG TPA: hypothetical protein ENH92_03255 [Ectothiorhodospiraceae bacterium]|nr:hypothetical protein [Ectothiorhodospiraceae bacterium]
MEHKSHTNLNLFEIEVGTQLQLQVGQLTGRLESTLIGIRAGKYLIITMPGESGQPAIRPDETGTSLVIRYIHQGNAYGFKSVVMDVITSTDRLLVISYPFQVEIFELRNYPRLNCFLPTRVFVDKQVIDGSLADISRTGAHFICTKSELVSNIAEHVNESIQLDIQLPGSDGYTHVVGNLRKVQASSDKFELGIRFENIEPIELTKLLSFLLDANALPEHQKFSAIIQKHYDWKEKVFNFIHADKNEKQNFALSPDECDLGKWLSSEGKSLYSDTESYQELDKTHRELHQKVAAAIKIREDGEIDKSIDFFNQLDIQHISHKIAALLIAADENIVAAKEQSS